MKFEFDVAESFGMVILQATTAEHMDWARELFREYAQWLGVSLCFQGFERELEGLPGSYAPPKGRLLLALEGKQLAGCIALRPMDEGVCELKRLFVRPAFRRQGMGRTLAQRILNDARDIGYKTIRLDTLEHMQDAIRTYERLGFVRCSRYYETPLQHTVFMELHL